MALLFSDLIALASCEYVALLVVQQAGSGPKRTLADLFLSVPLFVIVVISLSMNNAYATSPSQVLKNSFT